MTYRSSAKWRHDDGNLPTNVQSRGKGTLHIENTSSINTGNYKCEGTSTDVETFYAVGILKVKGEYFFFRVQLHLK